MKTREDILSELTGYTWHFIQNHPDIVTIHEWLKAMQIYADQESKKAVKEMNNKLIEVINNNTVTFSAKFINEEVYAVNANTILRHLSQ